MIGAANILSIETGKSPVDILIAIAIIIGIVDYYLSRKKKKPSGDERIGTYDWIPESGPPKKRA